MLTYLRILDILFTTALIATPVIAYFSFWSAFFNFIIMILMLICVGESIKKEKKKKGIK